MVEKLKMKFDLNKEEEMVDLREEGESDVAVLSGAGDLTESRRATPIYVER